jgi:hypothetical protein
MYSFVYIDAVIMWFLLLDYMYACTVFTLLVMTISTSFVTMDLWKY